MMGKPWEVGDYIVTDQGCWEIVKISQGGMGTVYSVYDDEAHVPFAVKTFRDDVFADDPSLGERFLKEAHAWINLDPHENVVQAHFVQIGSSAVLGASAAAPPHM